MSFWNVERTHPRNTLYLKEPTCRFGGFSAPCSYFHISVKHQKSRKIKRKFNSHLFGKQRDI